MRDVQRIYKFCNKLADLWATNCRDWRFGQLVCNVLNFYENPYVFYLEEDDMIKVFEEYFKNGRN